jgi:putative DNA primase/helicase
LVSARTSEPLTAPSLLRPGAAAGGLNLIDVSELEFLDT